MPHRKDNVMAMKKLKSIRKARGYTQGELAYMVGVSITAISLYENGARIPNIKTLAKLAKALRCRIADLIDNEDVQINTI